MSRYTPAHHRGDPLLSRRGRHLVGRFSYGITPALARQVRRQGGAEAWFDRQLSPASIADPGADELRSWWPSLDRSPGALWRRQVDGTEGGWEVMADYARWVLLRRMRSKRQLHELVTELWENHLNVPAVGDAQFVHRVDYGDTIRTHALGRFEDLLHAAITHPAMLIYLDNAVSTAKHPNENLGRELLELHTVGRGQYDEDDVKDSARILTGWTVDMWNTWTPSYDPKRHARGTVSVMGFSDANAEPDGRDLTRRYLSYLARHPATAARLARKLAVKLVSDDPPQALVDRLARVYLDHDTEIVPVLRALVGSAAFAEAVGAKVRDPGEDLVATYRALGVSVRRPTAEGNAANQLLWQVSDMGATPFGWPRPDGQPIDNDSWSSPARLLASMSVHYSMCGTWWPKEGIDYRPARSWLPEKRVRFDVLVDHLSQRLLHRRSTARLLRACCQATGLGPDEVITRDHALVKWSMPRLLTTFLDSPAFLTR
ncbi:DUF1800 domain-containing protein [Nocardioides sp. MAHUQ-72]|uniref:DUF1800 domain-containing protein n=1 Tax=unclassified Nocardioides TaxID=2615069 RepID=UPI00361989BE